MAAPNIAGITSIVGKTVTVDLTSTSATQIVSNASSSGKVFKINTIMVSNVDGTSAADITINFYSQAALGGTATEICKTISVPADASLVVLDKTSCIYLEEDKSLGAIAGAANDLKIVCSYEEIS
jgi:hypothetical protein